MQRAIDTTVLEKEDKSPVTIADFGSQAVICRAIRNNFPDAAIVAEEDSSVLRAPDQKQVLSRVAALVAGALPDADVREEKICDWIDVGNASGEQERFWTLDPIDGTKGFVRRDHYSIALALIEDGEVQLGVLGCPKLDPEGPGSRASEGSLLFAVRGEGAWQVPLPDHLGGGGDSSGSKSAPAPPAENPKPVDTTEKRRLRVSAASDPSEARFTESVESRHSSHSEAALVARRLGIGKDPLRLDSQVKYAVVARGDAEIYLRLLTDPSYRERIWDHAAGALLVTEAGGRVTDRHGTELDFGAGKYLGGHDDVVVTNGHIHDDVLEALEHTDRLA